MLTIGCHLSCAKGFLAMGKEAVTIDANTFQYFTRNPRGTKAKAMDLDDINRFRSFAEEHGISRILGHAPYTLNACSADEGLRKLARDTVKDDLLRMEYLPGNSYNFHPGNHVGQGIEVGIEYISQMLNEILNPDLNTTVLLETMSGKGSEVGRDFFELREILDRVKQEDRMGVCLDTCHIWDAGYDIKEDLDGVLHQFDQRIGLSKLKAIHLNDSLNPLGSRKDRHAKIGEGLIGFEALKRVVNHEALKDLPIYLETPNDSAGHAKEIAMLRNTEILN
ncbi:deoxyribonuclease IV [Clostridium sp. E02]|uniref:deoxyribonuclease IV n=1 Tax=Clostridium sp. E02 TaxID=2487134 RepID=UPI000F54911D|nr:deoxyribonuclease IV [Clostridium sp. E02]